jgi:hypothetical protein
MPSSLSRCLAVSTVLAVTAIPTPAGADPPVSVRENAPGATLLLPYFFVSRNGIQPPADIPAAGVDTVFRVVNTGATGVIVKLEIWNKYGTPLRGFNVPMYAADTFVASVREILNGHFNLNPNTQVGSVTTDPCGLNQSNNAYAPSVGFGSTKYIRFSNPDSSDRVAAISRYPTNAFTSQQRSNLLDSLDESSELTSFTYPPPAGVLDVDNPSSGVSGNGVLSGDFSGYLTLDVVNYCTTYFPDSINYYTNDAIATAGWSGSGYTPNVLIGSYKYVDSSCGTGGEYHPMPALAFDASLNWLVAKTFYSKYRTTGVDSGVGGGAQAPFSFVGDGRKPLGTTFAAEFQTGGGSSSHLVVWRSDLVNNPDVPGDVDIANWYLHGGPQNYAFADATHQLVYNTYDLDGSQFSSQNNPPLYVYLCTQRYAFPASQLNQGGFAAGWTSLTLPGNSDAQASLQTHQKECEADPNGDGLVNVSDVFYLINYLVAGGAPPK